MQKINAGTVALRELTQGDPGTLSDGPVEVTLREKDFQVISVTDPQTKQEHATGTVALVNFTAKRFREMIVDNVPSGVWEFTVSSNTPAGPVPSRVWVSGEDILFVKSPSKVL